MKERDNIQNLHRFDRKGYLSIVENLKKDPSYKKIETSVQEVIVDLESNNKRELDIPFQLFTEKESKLLFLQNVKGISKNIFLKGLKGNLLVTLMDDSEELLANKINKTITPWQEEPLTGYLDILVKSPLILGMSFNNNSKKAPKFLVEIPKAKNNNFIYLVSDWDVIKNKYDAVYDCCEPITLGYMELRFPRDPKKIQQIMLTASSDFMNYPKIVPYIVH